MGKRKRDERKGNSEEGKGIALMSVLTVGDVTLPTSHAILLFLSHKPTPVLDLQSKYWDRRE